MKTVSHLSTLAALLAAGTVLVAAVADAKNGGNFGHGSKLSESHAATSKTAIKPKQVRVGNYARTQKKSSTAASAYGGGSVVANPGASTNPSTTQVGENRFHGPHHPTE